MEDAGPQKANGVLRAHGWATAEPTPKLSLGSPTPWARRLFLSEWEESWWRVASVLSDLWMPSEAHLLHLPAETHTWALEKTGHLHIQVLSGRELNYFNGAQSQNHMNLGKKRIQYHILRWGILRPDSSINLPKSQLASELNLGPRRPDARLPSVTRKQKTDIFLCPCLHQHFPPPGRPPRGDPHWVSSKLWQNAFQKPFNTFSHLSTCQNPTVAINNQCLSQYTLC